MAKPTRYGLMGDDRASINLAAIAGCAKGRESSSSACTAVRLQVNPINVERRWETAVVHSPHYQDIARGGTCGKPPVTPHTRLL